MGVRVLEFHTVQSGLHWHTLFSSSLFPSVVSADTLREAAEVAAESEGSSIDFCVCNPPFFGSVEEADSQGRAEEQGRTPPSSDMSGTEEEKVWPQGGEVAFIKNLLLRDSMALRDRVR